MKKKIVAPHSVLIEKTAIEMCANFYEIGCKQGLKSKYKTTKHYTMANFEKLVPHAIHHLRQMLYNPSVSDDQKMLIHEAILERMNDPEAVALADSTAGHSLPDIDIAKLIPVGELPSVIANPKVVKDYGILGITGKRR